MSGDSGKRKKNDPKPTTPEPGPTVQAFMPGMDSMLAQQLSQGGYGQPNDLMAHFQSVYTPMQMPGPRPVDTSSSGRNSAMDPLWDALGPLGDVFRGLDVGGSGSRTTLPGVSVGSGRDGTTSRQRR